MADGGGHEITHLDWLNVELFELIFEKELNLNKTEFSLEIKSIKPAVGNAEHYVAVVTRVQVEFTKRNDKNSKPKLYSFIVKSIGDDPNVAGWVDKEVLFYSEIAPKLKEIEKGETYFPKSYVIPKELTEKYKSVIVEDLNPYGYKMLNRLEGLDLDHCKLFYKKLGGYHALTAACFEKNGSFRPTFHKSSYVTDAVLLSSFISTMFPDFIDIFTKYENLKPYYEKVKNWNHSILPQVQAVTEPNPDLFNVLCHGDAWTNNILYLHDENNKPNDLIFIDYQLTVFGTPILDIFYFFITSPTDGVRNNNFDELIQIYHNSLVENLKKYGYSKKIPTLRELHISILNSGPIACLLSIGMLALCLVAADKAGPMEVGLSDTEAGRKIRYNLFNGQRYLNAVESVLNFLDNRGLLVE